MLNTLSDLNNYLFESLEWHWRRIAAKMGMLCRTAVPLVEAEEPHQEPPRLVEPPFAETETGQLTLF